MNYELTHEQQEKIGHLEAKVASIKSDMRHKPVNDKLLRKYALSVHNYIDYIRQQKIMNEEQLKYFIEVSELFR